MKRKLSQESLIRSRTVLRRCLQSFHIHIKQYRVCSEIDRFYAGQVECEERCTLCLEQFKEGQNLARLECGHYFHCGMRDISESDAAKAPGCTGIIHWIGRARSCPICRGQVQPLTAKIRTDGKKEPNWQDAYVSSPLRTEVLEDIANICVEAVKTYDLNAVKNLSVEEMRKYNQKTASRVELALFSQSSNCEEYCDRRTLKYRTLLEIESMLSQRLHDITCMKVEELK